MLRLQRYVQRSDSVDRVVPECTKRRDCGVRVAMKRHGTPMKARIDKRLTEKGARKRYEIDFSREGEIDPNETEAMHALRVYEYEEEDKARMNQAELKALMDYWFDRMNNDSLPDLSQGYASGNYAALRDVYRTLYGEEGFTLREWVEMEGLTIDWPEETT